jgi:hypothetical protein
MTAGMSGQQAAHHFSIGESSALRWARRARKTGSPKAKPMGGTRPFVLEAHRRWITVRLAEKPDLTLTRVMGLSWDKGPDQLWRQGIDLIGDDGSDDVGEGIADGPMFGQSEGRELLYVTDNGFDNVASAEQRLVEE